MGLFDTFKKAVNAKDQATTTPQKQTVSAPSLNPNTDKRNSLIAGIARDPNAITHSLLFVGMSVDWNQLTERDMLRMLPSWECTFISDAAQAVATLKDKQFNAVILHSDIAGDATLTEAVSKSPARTVRLMLCDTNDRNEVARWSNAGYSPLSKTTDAVNLAANINRIAQVQEWMTDSGIKKLISLCKKLPAMPTLYAQVSKELSSPNGSIDVVAQLIAQDPVMTAKILQVVNSAFFALGRTIGEPSEAVMFLGAERTRSLILLAGVFTQFEGVSSPGFTPEQIWNHSLQVGAFARTITMYETKNAKTAEAAFTAGLIHDMGKLILAANVPTMCGAIEQMLKAKQLNQRDAELQVLSTTHAELAASLLGTWALPLPVLESVAWHHHPTTSRDKGFSLLTAVHVANVFAYEMGAGSQKSSLPETLSHEYLIQIGLGNNRNDWRKACNIPQRIEEDAEHTKIRLRIEAKIN